jgi:flagellar basal-body rod protein FlgB
MAPSSMDSPARMFGRTYDVLETVLDRRARRHALIAANVANLETPNYRGTDLAFESRLRNYLASGMEPVTIARTDPRHLPTGQAAWGPPSRSMDTGPVHLDIEMAKLAENNLMYNALVQVMAKKFNMLKMAITEGGK